MFLSILDNGSETRQTAGRECQSVLSPVVSVILR